MKKQDLLNLKFKEISHFTIGDSMTYDLGRHRQLSVSCVGTPNEMCFLIELDNENKPTKITDLICVHNYDYDGYLSEAKITALINAITYKF